MKEAKIVIGANFGDEGKGLMTDYFCSQFGDTTPVLNVRFNGGAQAGHTVVAPDGRKHIFSHFGAGSFLPNVATYLSKDFIVNPILFRREYEKLAKLGIYPMVYAHPKCLFTMPQDMMINQFMEKRRGEDRHVSCGVGIYETVMRSKSRTMVLEDFKHTMPRYQVDINYYEAERIEKAFSIGLDDKEKALLSNQNIRAHFDQDIQFFTEHVSITDERIFENFNYVVFEGGQGLMLDQNNMEYFPHLTPSNTGIENVLGYLNKDVKAEVCYVSRPYLTRHGAGRLDGECLRESIGAKIDLTNHENEWQGHLRYAKLDLKDLIKRCRYDFRKLESVFGLEAEMTICITHTDEFMDHLIADPDSTYIPDIMRPIFYRDYDECPIKYVSCGPTRNDVKFLK